MRYPDRQYPGEFLDRLKNASEYPIPFSVGRYTKSLEEYLSYPKWIAQWVHFPERTKLVIEGRYDEIKPVHFEGIFTLVCNMLCPHCTQRPARTKWIDDDTWKPKVSISEKNTLSLQKIKYIIDQIADFKMDNYIGIVWGGGDPTAYPWIYESLNYAGYKGIYSSFLTNGVFLDVNKLLESKPYLIRISLDCGTPENYAIFHGCKMEWGYFEKAVSNIEQLARYKNLYNKEFLLGISLIGDERNIDDLPKAIDILINIQEKYPNSIDYIIVRPVMEYSHFDTHFGLQTNNTKQKLYHLLKEGTPLHEKCKNYDCPLILVKDSFQDPPLDEDYSGYKCLSYGWYGQIKYNGDIQLCSDSYCNPEYTIGNIFKESLNDIWKNAQRTKILTMINERKCFLYKCPYNSRGHHLNRIFNQIEIFRGKGKIETAVKWINDLRKLTIPPLHSFFM